VQLLEIPMLRIQIFGWKRNYAQDGTFIWSFRDSAYEIHHNLWCSLRFCIEQQR
jgi:hypothetical protein